MEKSSTRLIILTEDLTRNIIELDVSVEVNEKVWKSILRKVRQKTVFKNLCFEYTYGVEKGFSTKTKFQFVSANVEIKIAGRLKIDAISQLPSHISFNLSGFTENGLLEEKITKNRTPSLFIVNGHI